MEAPAAVWQRELPATAWGRHLQAVLQNGYVRVAVQCAVGTLLVFIIFWPPTVWDALSLDNVLANPTLVLVLYYLVLLISLGAGLSALQTSLEVIGGSLVGGACGIGVTYLTLLANGGTYQDTVKKAATFMCLTGFFMFLTTVGRFRFQRFKITYVFLQLVFAVATTAAYHKTSRLYLFTLYWYAYASIGAAIAWLMATLVLPRPAGRTVRRNLGRALRATGSVLTGVVPVMTGEINEAGLLEAASGETSERIGIDSGLYPQLEPIFKDAVAAGSNLQAAYKYLPATRWEYNVYRKQHIFPTAKYRLIALLIRATLSCVMMACYPVQTGNMQCRLIRRHREELRQLAAAFQACCDGLAAVFMDNAPVSFALERLSALERSFSSLSRAASFKNLGASAAGRASQDLVVLDMVLSLMFSACTRLRRIFLLLPDALGRTQPDCRALVVAHFSASANWDLTSLTKVPVQRGESNALQLLRTSLLDMQQRQSLGEGQGSPQARRAPGGLLDFLRHPPPVKQAAVQERRLGPGRRALQRLRARTGVTPQHLALALQMLVAFEVVTLLVILPDVNAALYNHMYWAVFIVVTVLEPSAGASIFKAALRFAGTLLGGALGLASLYFTYLVNGLSYDNHPQKFIVMAICVSLLSGAGALLSVRYAMYHYCFLVMNIIIVVTALPGLTGDTPMPKVVLYRIINTCIGVAVEMIVCATVFPVTARQVFENTMRATLLSLAECVDAAFHHVLPIPHSTPKQRPGRESRPAQVVQAHASTAAPEGLGQGSAAPGYGSDEPDSSSVSGRSVEDEETRPLRPSQDMRRAQQRQQQQQGEQQPGRPPGGSLELQPSPRGRDGMATRKYDSAVRLLEGSPHAVSSADERQRVPPAALPSPPALDRVTPGSPLYFDLLEQQRRRNATSTSQPRPAAAAAAAAAAGAGPATAAAAPGSPAAPPAGQAGLGPALLARNGSAGPAVVLDMTPPASPSGSFGSARPKGTRAAAGTDSPATPGRRSDAVEQVSHTTDLTVWVNLEPGSRHRIIGTSYARLIPSGVKATAGMAAMMQLSNALRVETLPFASRQVFPVDTAFRAQRLCRHMLNTVATFAITMDSQEVAEVPLLAPYSHQLEAVIRQLVECMRAFAGMVQELVEVNSAVEMVLLLEDLVSRLFLVVLLGERPPNLSQSDVITGLALLAMLANAAYVARLLCIALVSTFYANDGLAMQHVRSLLDTQTRWAVDQELLLLANGILGVALGATSGLDSGLLTPVRSSEMADALDALANTEQSLANEQPLPADER